jgi:hypothetical protein
VPISRADARQRRPDLELSGGVWANGNVTLASSTVTGNTATGANTSGGVARGGGAAVAGNFQAAYALVSGNKALPDGLGGGLHLTGSDNTFTEVTISGNVAGGSSDSTGNGKAGAVAIVSAGAGSTTRMYNSTITLNSSLYDPPGVRLTGPLSVTLQSTLIANNISPGPNRYDLSVSSGPITFDNGSGNNLIQRAISGLPADTITGSCPLLGPLRDNGGLTLTHAVLSGSPAIDKGNDAQSLNEDQRGQPDDVPIYPYARISGPAADIGAYEVQKDDIVFNTGFEGC